MGGLDFVLRCAFLSRLLFIAARLNILQGCRIVLNLQRLQFANEDLPSFTLDTLELSGDIWVESPVNNGPPRRND